jgi:hypothetical protein
MDIERERGITIKASAVTVFHRHKPGAKTDELETEYEAPVEGRRRAGPSTRPRRASPPRRTASSSCSTSSIRPGTSTSTTKSPAPSRRARAPSSSSTPPRACRPRRSSTRTSRSTKTSPSSPSSTRSTCPPPARRRRRGNRADAGLQGRGLHPGLRQDRPGHPRAPRGDLRKVPRPAQAGGPSSSGPSSSMRSTTTTAASSSTAVVFDGELKVGDKIRMMGIGRTFQVTEIGKMNPKPVPLARRQGRPGRNLLRRRRHPLAQGRAHRRHHHPRAQPRHRGPAGLSAAAPDGLLRLLPRHQRRRRGPDFEDLRDASRNSPSTTRRSPSSPSTPKRSASASAAGSSACSTWTSSRSASSARATSRSSRPRPPSRTTSSAARHRHRHGRQRPGPLKPSTPSVTRFLPGQSPRFPTQLLEVHNPADLPNRVAHRPRSASPSAASRSCCPRSTSATS